MNQTLRTVPKTLFSRDSWRAVTEYVRRLGRRINAPRLDNPDSLANFLDSRASHVAQTALYGYLKTRAGMRFPVLFDDPTMLASINIAKWHIWLACLSDLAVYSGVLIDRRVPSAQIGALLAPVVAQVIARVGAPDEAGSEFPIAAQQPHARIQTVDFAALRDDDSAFTESPAALVRWAPIVDELKQRDAAIIRNSVRFRWLAIRRELRKQLCAEALVRSSATE